LQVYGTTSAYDWDGNVPVGSHTSRFRQQTLPLVLHRSGVNDDPFKLFHVAQEAIFILDTVGGLAILPFPWVARLRFVLFAAATD